MASYTIEQRVQMIKLYYQNECSLVKTLRPFYGRRDDPSNSTLQRLVAKFETIGSVNNLPTPVHQKNARSTDNIAAVRVLSTAAKGKVTVAALHTLEFYYLSGQPALIPYFKQKISAYQIHILRGDPVSYSIVSGNDLRQFAIGAKTGVMTIIRQLDREDLNRYQLVYLLCFFFAGRFDLKFVLAIIIAFSLDPMITPYNYDYTPL
ncbi:hypothetical protein NQ318_000372 [Aromia moschata]|uniref:Cadherin domain-containing protein n=1 Tax=Aromia moschata TaxID=1265417 RepID=A0AAV8YU04_9CUCU|nr:hypothetical protein NQ318_000372 [Aromia moschata]